MPNETTAPASSAPQAEATLRRVLERIPAEVFATFDCEILVVDDASEDRTFVIGQEYQQHHPDIATRMLRKIALSLELE